MAETPNDDDKSTTHRHLDRLLVDAGVGELRTFVLDNPAMSWRRLASRITTLTGHDISDVTLARYFADDDEITTARHAVRT